MKREEAIERFNGIINAMSISIAQSKFYPSKAELDELCDMAIEALQEPKTIIGIDIPYGSDKGIATIFKGKDDKLILEDIKEVMSVVRCKDCKYQNECEEMVLFDINDDEVMGHRVHWCSYGKSK